MSDIPRMLCRALVPVAALVFSSAAVAGSIGDPVAGKKKSATCIACHGEDGNSVAPTFPKLAGQHANYILHALKGYKSGSRKNPIMAPQAMNLSDEDMEDLAAWYSSQSGLMTLEGKN